MRYLLICLLGWASQTFAADITPYNGPQVSAPAPGYQLRVGDKRYTLGALQAFPLYQTRLSYPIWDVDGVFAGPKLIDVLGDAGIAEFRRLYLEASDDYSITLRQGQAGLNNALIAFQLDGKPLVLNDKGPFWLVWPDTVEQLVSGEDGGNDWIWSLIEIRKAR